MVPAPYHTTISTFNSPPPGRLLLWADWNPLFVYVSWITPTATKRLMKALSTNTELFLQPIELLAGATKNREISDFFCSFILRLICVKKKNLTFFKSVSSGLLLSVIMITLNMFLHMCSHSSITAGAPEACNVWLLSVGGRCYHVWLVNNMFVVTLSLPLSVSVTDNS